MILTDFENNYSIKSIDASISEAPFRTLNLKYFDRNGEHVTTIFVYEDEMIDYFISGTLEFEDMYNLYLGIDGEKSS